MKNQLNRPYCFRKDMSYDLQNPILLEAQLRASRVDLNIPPSLMQQLRCDGYNPTLALSSVNLVSEQPSQGLQVQMGFECNFFVTLEAGPLFDVAELVEGLNKGFKHWFPNFELIGGTTARLEAHLLPGQRIWTWHTDLFECLKPAGTPVLDPTKVIIPHFSTSQGPDDPDHCLFRCIQEA